MAASKVKAAEILAFDEVTRQMRKERDSINPGIGVFTAEQTAQFADQIWQKKKDRRETLTKAIIARQEERKLTIGATVGRRPNYGLEEVPTQPEIESKKAKSSIMSKMAALDRDFHKHNK